ncbi:MAG TPA: hypothetical protein VEJ46_01030 [Candidatus Acidoferrum sp.]|nr:hypothetical protein [Candidatus Acidoferrum sp.]
MSKEHAKAVRESDLYEHQGIAKSLLERIALLIIGPRKEDERGKPIGEPHPDEGWCVASQGVLAAMHGCSRKQVNCLVEMYERDGWLTKDDYRNEAGHLRCRYTITPQQLKKIQKRAMKKYPPDHPQAGEYIRAAAPRKARKSSFKKGGTVAGKTVAGETNHGSTHVEPTLDGKPCDTVSQSLVTSCHQALRQSVTKPCDKLSQNMLTRCVVPSLVDEIGCFQDKTKTTSISLPKEGKEKQEQAVATLLPDPTPPTGGGKKPRRRTMTAAFKPDVERQFRLAGAPPEWFEAIAGLTGTIDMLNGENLCGCPYPVKAWKTVAENHPQWKASQIWTPKVLASGDFDFQRGVDEDDDLPSLTEQAAMKRMNESLTPEERERNSAEYWWTNLYPGPDTKGLRAAQAAMEKAYGVQVRWKEYGHGEDTYSRPNMEDVVRLYRAFEDATMVAKAVSA